MKTHNKETGFTLIGLMMVILMVAMLLNFAVPACRDHVIRTKVAEGMAATAVTKIAVSQYFSATGQLPPGRGEADSRFILEFSYPYVESVDWHDEQWLEIEFSGDELGLSNKLELGLQPRIVGDKLEWHCVQVDVSEDSFKYLPERCRNHSEHQHGLAQQDKQVPIAQSQVAQAVPARGEAPWQDFLQGLSVAFHAQ